MKLSRILTLVIDGAVAGIVVSGASPAQALDWTWSYSDGAGLNASGTFTTNDSPDGSGFYTISDIAGNRNGSAITALSAPGGLGDNDNLISQSSPYLTRNGFSYLIGATGYNVYYSGDWIESSSSSSEVILNSFTASVSAAVPFDIPGGATIPTFGSLFALGLMRKAKKRLAAKKLVVNPVETAV